ncbi:3-methyl-2-oxobutanoate hydroxymethyltransferase, partial [Candidatus Heimdallarchaeota archaeon]
MKKTAFDIRKMKRSDEKITMLTAYDSFFAAVFDKTEIDMLLVGDSMGTVIYGSKDTLNVTLEMLINHSQAVSRGAKENALVVADMPFLSFGVSMEETIKNAGRLIREGHAEAVKMEGASPRRLMEIQSIIDIGIPVQGHIGLLPQSALKIGGYKVQGKKKSFWSEEDLISAAKKIEAVGCFSIILEAIPYKVAKKITEEISIPTIG